METTEKFLSLLGLSLVNIIPAAITSFAALRFFDGLSTKDKWTVFLGGWAIASWGAHPLREYLDLKPSVEIGLVLLLGLFGMAVVAEVVKLIRQIDWSVIGRFFGRKE
jgi:hypothetical protein